MLTWTGFADTYYNWDFNRPAVERSYTTQAAKHNTPSVNLLMLGVTQQSERYRGSLVLQKGDSVDLNYAGEPLQGKRVNFMQEAYLGAKLGETWLDGGIYLGHIGMESFVSRDNWTYTRLMMSEFSPYYAAGLRWSGTHGKNEWQLHLMQGWQRINEDNHGKSVGGRYQWNLPQQTLTYNTQVGQEVFSGRQTSGMRTFHDLVWERPGLKLDWKGAMDFGTQNVPGEKRALVWGAIASQWRWRLPENWALAWRAEYFHDEKGMVAPTGSMQGLRAYGASVNIDRFWGKNLLGRLELRRLQAAQRVYPGQTRAHGSDTFLVSSLSAGF